MTAFLLSNAEQVFLDNNGVPLALGTVGMFIPNTMTPKATWQDAAQATLNTNPINLDSAGRAIIYGNGTYRQIVNDALGNTIWDQITGIFNTSTLPLLTNGESSLTASAGMPVYISAADTFKIGKANIFTTSKIFGVAADDIAHGAMGNLVLNGNILILLTSQWDALTGASGGLTFATYYFLSPSTFGHLTATAPSTVGQSITLVGIGLSTTEMLITINEPILL